MPADELLARVRSLSRIPFESSSRGAVCLQRLRWGLPRSAQLPLLDELQQAWAAIDRTIHHPHEHERWLDQYEEGERLELRRHVTEEGRRWTFTVRLLARKDGSVTIDDADLKRPGDENENENENEGDDEDEGVVVEPVAGAGVPEGMVACPCCGHATLSERGAYQICPVCFWEDDGQDNADAARGGPNHVSLTEGRRNFLACGASIEAERDRVRRPIAEEVQLRRFDAAGRELP